MDCRKASSLYIAPILHGKGREVNDDEKRARIYPQITQIDTDYSK